MMDRWKPSVTVAGIIEKDGKYLLVEEHTPNGLMFNNPAGHLDPGESPLQACVREVLEETAFHFTPTALVGVYLSRFLSRPRLTHQSKTSLTCVLLSRVSWVRMRPTEYLTTVLCEHCG